MDILIADRKPLNRVPADLDQDDVVARCLSHGAAVLTLRECLSVLLNQKADPNRGEKLAARLLQILSPQMPEQGQRRALFSSLTASNGLPSPALHVLGRSDQARLLAALEIGRRFHLEAEESKGPGHGLYPDEIARKALKKVPAHWRDLSVEWLGFVPVFKTRVGEFCPVERGVRTHVNTDPQELFARILVLRPAMILLFHNHPSGELTPSPHDIDLTVRVEDTCARLGIRFHSHWIVSGAKEAQVIP